MNKKLFEFGFEDPVPKKEFVEDDPNYICKCGGSLVWQRSYWKGCVYCMIFKCYKCNSEIIRE